MNQSTTKETKIGFLTRVAYGSGDVACNIVYGMISTLLVLFYTDYAGVPAYLAGLVMLISRIFDGVSDVVMGYIVSRTHSRFGQSRPWIIRMALPYAIGAVLLFTIPQTNSTVIQFLYIFITYNFVTTICYTAINVRLHLFDQCGCGTAADGHRFHPIHLHFRSDHPDGCGHDCLCPVPSGQDVSPNYEGSGGTRSARHALIFSGSESL